MKHLHSLIVITFITLLLSPISWADSDKASLALVKTAIDKSGFTAQQSIKKVQKLYSGIVYQYELDDEDDQFFHEVKLIDIDADQKIKVLLSIKDGSVVDEEISTLFSWFSESKRVIMTKKLALTNHSLLSAIETIALNKNSLLVEAELEEKQGVLYFELETFGPEGDKDWLVDAHNNALIPVFQR